MVYIDPTPTIADEALITKTWSDTVYQNLYHLQKRTSYKFGVANGASTTSASLVIATGTDTVINIPTTSLYIVVFQGHFQHSVANGAFTIGLAVDGSAVHSARYNTQLGSNVTSMYHFATAYLLPAGNRTISLAFSTASGGTLTMSSGYGNNYIMWEVGD